MSFLAGCHVGCCAIAFSILLSTSISQADDQNHFCALHDHIKTAPKSHSKIINFAKQNEWSLGSKRLLYYRIRFADETNGPCTIDEAEEALQLANETFERISYGQFSLSWEITPILRLSNTATHYLSLGYDSLLQAAQTEAEKAGFRHTEFDLDLVRYNPDPQLFGGFANIGTRGAWTQLGDAKTIVHEICHNLGLAHANAWSTYGPANFLHTSPPFPTGLQNEVHRYDFGYSGMIGQDSIIGPGEEVEYGDVFDIMGSGGIASQVHVPGKHRLGWLANSAIQRIETNGLYRLYAFNAPGIQENRIYGLTLERLSRTSGTRRQYWIQFRSDLEDSTGAFSGIQLLWFTSGKFYESSLLIDSTPEGRGILTNPELAFGRTFSDSVAQIYITPLKHGSDEDGQWADVSIQFGPFATNLPPRLELIAEHRHVNTNVPVQFTALASDENGDAINYHWDFGDNVHYPNVARVQKLWEAPGEYVIRCEVSDGRGGSRSKHAVVTVGKINTSRITGRVLTSEGSPLPGVRVHNGRTSQGAGGYAFTFTDSDGSYTLPNQLPGSYTNGAVLFGYEINPSSRPTVSIMTTNVEQFDFVAVPIPTVSVQAGTADILEGGAPGTFIITRNGFTGAPLNVPIQLIGTAQDRVDFSVSFDQVVEIPAGSKSTTISIKPLVDGQNEPIESVTLELQYATAFTRKRTNDLGQAILYTAFYPGWDLEDAGGTLQWKLTNPPYLLASPSFATIKIHDASSAPLKLSIGRSLRSTFEIILNGPPGTYVLQHSLDFQIWEPVSTNSLSGSETGMTSQAIYKGTNGFYRVIRK